MKAIVIDQYGGTEVLQLKDIQPPVPRENEVVVKVHAAGVNPIDWQIRAGLVKAFIRPPFPAILGCDLSGEVVQVGSSVNRLKTGDLVFGMMPHDWGAQAELVAIREDLLAIKPATISMVEAGAVGAVAVTAVQALRDIAKVKPGMSVLINGATGGVGLAAVQIAKNLGADVTAVCSRASFELVKALGADHLIDYKTTDFSEGSQQFDIIFDTIGNKPFNLCKPVLRSPWVHIITMPTGRTFLRMMLNLFSANKVVPIIAKSNNSRIEFIRKLLVEGRFKVVIDRVLPASDIVEAQNYSQSGRAKGKIVLTFV